LVQHIPATNCDTQGYGSAFEEDGIAEGLGMHHVGDRMQEKQILIS
jgi:hypothetical protein